MRLVGVRGPCNDAYRPRLAGGQSFDITLSIGVAQAMTQASLEDVLRQADLALYRAKQNGRNRVETAPSPMVLAR